MTARPNPARTRQVYAFCCHLVNDRERARRIALEALTDPQPLRRAVALSLAEPPAAGDALDAWAALEPRERAALLLIDYLHLTPAEAARWAQIPQAELLALCHAGRKKLAGVE